MPQTPVERFESHFFQCLKNCVARKNFYQKGVLIGKIPKEERIDAIRRVARQFIDFVENPDIGDYMTQAFADAKDVVLILTTLSDEPYFKNASAE